LTFEILKLTKFMITHGFFKTQTELNSLAIPLIALLDGSNDIYEDGGAIVGGRRYVYSKEN